MCAKLKFATDIEKPVLINNCEARGWTMTTPEDDWNIFWASVQSTRLLFSTDSCYRLSDNQVSQFHQTKLSR